jgi:hypothetical protein
MEVERMNIRNNEGTDKAYGKPRKGRTLQELE